MLFLLIQQILERNSIQILINDFIQSLPERKCGAVILPLAFQRLMLQTSNRSEASLGKAQDLTDCVVIRTLGQFVSALESAVRLKNIGTVQNRDDLFQIFL